MAYRKGGRTAAYAPSFLPFTALYWLVIGLVFAACGALFGLRIRGRGNLRRASRAILVSNHTLVMDPGVIAVALWPRRAYFTMLEETAGIPWLGTFVRLLGGIPIPEGLGGLRSLQRAVDQGIRDLGYVHFFPEGECYLWNQELRPFQPGAFLMAEQLSLPIIPLTLVLRERGGLARLLPPLLAGRVPVPPRVTIVIGPPVSGVGGGTTHLAGHCTALSAGVGTAQPSRPPAECGSVLATQVHGMMQRTIDAEGGSTALFRGQMRRVARKGDRPLRVA